MKINVLSVLLLSVIAANIGTTITTTIQIQPAYSQASHCLLGTCVTQGKDPSLTQPNLPPREQAHQAAAGLISDCHKEARTQCTVTQP